MTIFRAAYLCIEIHGGTRDNGAPSYSVAVVLAYATTSTLFQPHLVELQRLHGHTALLRQVSSSHEDSGVCSRPHVSELGRCASVMQRRAERIAPRVSQRLWMPEAVQSCPAQSPAYLQHRKVVLPERSQTISTMQSPPAGPPRIRRSPRFYTHLVNRKPYRQMRRSCFPKSPDGWWLEPRKSPCPTSVTICRHAYAAKQRPKILEGLKLAIIGQYC